MIKRPILNIYGRYANALFLDIKKEELDASLICLYNVLKFFKSHKIAFRLISGNTLSNAQKHNLLDAVIDILKIDGIIKKFLYLLVSNKRFFYMDKIIQEFESKVDIVLNRSRVTIEHAEKLTEIDKEIIEKLLSELLRSDIIPTYVLKPDLIGGFAIVKDGVYYDASMKAQFDLLRKTLKGY